MAVAEWTAEPMADDAKRGWPPCGGYCGPEGCWSPYCVVDRPQDEEAAAVAATPPVRDVYAELGLTAEDFLAAARA